MKIFKQITAITTAAVMAAGTMCVDAFAADTYKLYVSSNPAAASIGDTVKVSVLIDTPDDGIGVLGYHLEFDTDYLEYQADTAKAGIGGDQTLNDMASVNVNYAAEGWIGFAYMSERAKTGTAVESLSLEFKILKPNAVLTLTQIEITAADFDGTDITDKGTYEGAKIACSHKNTEKQTIPATCKDEGEEKTVCKDCGQVVKTETLPKTEDHDWGEWVTKENVKCGETADQTRTCKICGKTETKTGEKVEHLWDSGKVTKEATCTEDGAITYTCTREGCGGTKTEEIKALAHQFSEDKEVIKAPTCTEEGQEKCVCERCGEDVISDIPALGHDWGEWAVTKEATSEQEGEEARECNRCGEKETKTIEKLPPEVTTTTFNGHFYVPETTAASSAPAESEAVTAAQTTAAPVSDQTSDAATTTATDAPPVDNTPTDTDSSNDNAGTYETAAAENTSNDVGNVNGNNDDSKNLPTGVVLAVIPAFAAAAGVVIFKKRK